MREREVTSECFWCCFGKRVVLFAILKFIGERQGALLLKRPDRQGLLRRLNQVLLKGFGEWRKFLSSASGLEKDTNGFLVRWTLYFARVNTRMIVPSFRNSLDILISEVRVLTLDGEYSCGAPPTLHPRTMKHIRGWSPPVASKSFPKLLALSSTNGT